VKSIRKGKLSDPSNIKDSVAGGNESRIFWIAPDSSDFDSESMTVTNFSNFCVMQILRNPEYFRENLSDIHHLLFIARNIEIRESMFRHH